MGGQGGTPTGQHFRPLRVLAARARAGTRSAGVEAAQVAQVQQKRLVTGGGWLAAGG